MASEFNLEIPNEEEVKETVKKALAPTEQEESAIEDKALDTADQIMTLDLSDIDKRREYVSVVEQFGLTELSSYQSKNAILQKRIGTMQREDSETSLVAKGLTDLTLKMKELDPSGMDFARTGILGKLFNPVRKYFEKFKSADAEITAICRSLDNGKKTLIADSTTLELEETDLRKLVKKMQLNIQLGMQLDAKLETAIEQARAAGTDEEKVRFVEEEILYPLRQRIEDFQQVMLVGQQGIVAMEIIRRNNKELVRSVDRAENVTVTALRTAVTVAGALYDQKMVLDAVQTVNAATAQMIEGTSQMLHQQGAQIQQQASEAAIDPEVLKRSFEETFAALDEIERYKQEALPKMKETIAAFFEIAQTGEKRIEKLEQGVDA